MYNILPLLFIDVLKVSLADLFNKVLLKLQLSEDALRSAFKSFCELPNNLFSSVPPCWTEMFTKYGIYTIFWKVGSGNRLIFEKREGLLLYHVIRNNDS